MRPLAAFVSNRGNGTRPNPIGNLDAEDLASIDDVVGDGGYSPKFAEQRFIRGIKSSLEPPCEGMKSDRRKDRFLGIKMIPPEIHADHHNDQRSLGRASPLIEALHSRKGPKFPHIQTYTG